MGFYNLYNLLLVVLLIVILVKVSRYTKASKSHLQNLDDKIDRLRKLLEEQKSPISSAPDIPEKPAEEISPVFTEPIPIINPIQETTVPEEVAPEMQPEYSFAEDEFIYSDEEHSDTVHFTNDEYPVEKLTENVQERKYIEPKKPWLQTFKEENPDIEKFIGENLINKIGILILVLGISFFVKYAIDKNWINEPARVGIGWSNCIRSCPSIKSQLQSF